MEMAGQVLHVYASGDGALHFNWSFPDGMSSGRSVNRWHCLRFLRTKEGKRLTNNGFKLYHINGFWTLVDALVRRNTNTLCMKVYPDYKGECFTYTIVPKHKRTGKDVWDCDLTVWSKYPAKYKRPGRYEVKNWSIRAAIRYFLSHEEELKRAEADEKGVVHYPKQN